MKRYSDYRKSDISWMDNIPSSWTIKKIKYSTLFRQGGAWGEEQENDENDRVCIRVE